MAEVKTDTGKPLIYGKYNGPGAGRYQLPSTCGHEKHDYTKHKKPAYSFGIKPTNSMYGTDVSPGPKHLPDPKITRHGMAGDYKYSMLGRARDGNPFKTPAPGTYSPEKCHPQHEKHAPKYSFSSRTRYRKQDTTPGPNSNTLPSLLSKNPLKQTAPCYSMTGRSEVGGFAEVTVKTPGPCAYKINDPNTTKNRSASYTMKGRSFMPGDSNQKPGPGAHYPERVTITKKKAASCSLGIRHSEYVTPLIVQVVD